MFIFKLEFIYFMLNQGVEKLMGWVWYGMVWLFKPDPLLILLGFESVTLLTYYIVVIYSSFHYYTELKRLLNDLRSKLLESNAQELKEDRIRRDQAHTA